MKIRFKGRVITVPNQLMDEYEKFNLGPIEPATLNVYLRIGLGLRYDYRRSELDAFSDQELTDAVTEGIRREFRINHYRPQKN